MHWTTSAKVFKSVIFNSSLMKITNQKIAECVGLWLAEGDNKTNNEITFTNNCLELVLFFHENITKLYSGRNLPRLYIYSSTPKVLITELNGLRIKNYMDLRANRIYYIYRLADTGFVKEWKRLVYEVKQNQEFWPEILRGIFAGEGNVKHDLQNNNSRNLRIAAGKRNEFIEKLLQFFQVPIKYDSEKRMYWIHGRHLDYLDAINIASLHPEKEAKFRKMMNSVKEKHFSPHEIEVILLSKLVVFKGIKELANEVSRSEIHLLQVLRNLKQANKIDCLKVNGKWLWIRKELKEAFLEEEKRKILRNLKKYSSVTQLSMGVGIYRKAITKRLKEYQRKELVVRVNRNHWKMTEKGKVIVGLDESGSE